MKKSSFKTFNKDVISTRELNHLKGGTSSFKGDPVSDIIVPTRY